MDRKVPKSVQSRADDLEERLVDFAVRIIKLAASLPKARRESTLPDK